MNCIYCKKTFNNKYILKNHQKTAKYCLKIQGIEPESLLVWVSPQSLYATT